MIRVERSEELADDGAEDALLESLDSQPGAWLGCDVEADGLFKRASMGCVSPALGFFLDGNRLRVLAFTPVGHALLAHVSPLGAFAACPGGLVARFADATKEPHPVIEVLRA